MTIELTDVCHALWLMVNMFMLAKYDHTFYRISY